MAQIFRPTYNATDAKTGKAVKRTSPTWWIRYYTPGGERKKVRGYRDRKATESLATDLERRAMREHAGLTDPAEVHAKRPAAEHVEDFRAYLTAKGNTAPYVSMTLFRLKAVLDGGSFVRLADIQASAVVQFLAGLRRDNGDRAGASTKTANEYLAAAKGFCRWLYRDRRIVVDPLACLSRLTQGAADIRRARRDYTTDELHWLMSTAEKSARPFRILGGRDRRMLYLLAVTTGFRAAEIASMTPESFDLAGDSPTATVKASCTKNRRPATQPLRLDVAAELRDYLTGKLAGRRVWPGTWAKSASAKMIRRDLADARKAWLSGFPEGLQRDEAAESDFLAYCDSQGRYADFHCLRHSFITMIGKTGVSAREHMDLSRHSSYALTARYSHSRAYNLAAAVQSLPITVGEPEPQAAAATGTDGRDISLGPPLGPQSPKSLDLSGQIQTSDSVLSAKKNPEKQGESAVFQGDEQTDKNWRRRELNPRAVVLQRRRLRVYLVISGSLALRLTSRLPDQPPASRVLSALSRCFVLPSPPLARLLRVSGDSEPELVTRP